VLHLSGTPQKDIGDVLRTLKIRNDIVHRGYIATANDTEILHRMMTLTAKLIGLDELKTPELDNGNSLSAPQNAAARPPE
jgi:hypothetical protein